MEVFTNQIHPNTVFESLRHKKRQSETISKHWLLATMYSASKERTPSLREKTRQNSLKQLVTAAGFYWKTWNSKDRTVYDWSTLGVSIVFLNCCWFQKLRARLRGQLFHQNAYQGVRAEQKWDSGDIFKNLGETMRSIHWVKRWSPKIPCEVAGATTGNHNMIHRIRLPKHRSWNANPYIQHI